MSVTHPDAVLTVTSSRRIGDRHSQLAPFAVAVVIALASALVSLAITGLPA